MMSSRQVEILFICGSPRAHNSEALLALLEQGVRDVGARSRKFLLSKKHIAPCNGCGYCEKTGTCVLTVERSNRYINDDYLELEEALSYADALAIVSPLYFAGPPAQLKALFDRMQPFWSREYLLKQGRLPKRPAQVFILGGGGDAHGYDPLITIAKSSLAVAGFTVEKVQNFVGFKQSKDVPHLPTSEEAAAMSYVELSHVRKEVSLQREFEQRAVAAGSAFARFAARSAAKDGLQTADDNEDRDENRGENRETILLSTQGEAAAAAHNREPEPPETSALPDDHELGAPVTVVDRVDSDFEALKQAARASKSSRKKPRELSEAIEEAVAHLNEHHDEPADNACDEAPPH